MALAAQAKVLAAETAVKVTNDALQLHGAAGYSRARAVERMVRDARMFTIKQLRSIGHSDTKVWSQLVVGVFVS